MWRSSSHSHDVTLHAQNSHSEISLLPQIYYPSYCTRQPKLSVHFAIAPKNVSAAEDIARALVTGGRARASAVGDHRFPRVYIHAHVSMATSRAETPQRGALASPTLIESDQEIDLRQRQQHNRFLLYAYLILRVSAVSAAGLYSPYSQNSTPFSSASPGDILHVGKLDEVVQCSSYRLHARQTRRQNSSTRCGSVKLLFLVPTPRGKPERRMKEMEHRSGTFFSGISVYASRISIADHGAAKAAAQQQQHSSSSTAAAAQQQWWQRRRGYGRKGRAWIHR